MKSAEALRVLADITAAQWGMVTSGQAGALGVTRLDLTRLAEAGHLERLSHGVYRNAGAPTDRFEGLRAAWLSTDPKVLAENRLQNRSEGVVVAGASAAGLHEIGDLWAERHEFVAPGRRQTQRSEIRYRKRVLGSQDVTLVHGLPAMTLERTIADLVEEISDLSLVADALRDAARVRSLNFERLRHLLAPLAGRYGLAQHDGGALVDLLRETAGIDVTSIARRVAADPALGASVAASYLSERMARDVGRLIVTPELAESLFGVRQASAKQIPSQPTAHHDMLARAVAAQPRTDAVAIALTRGLAASIEAGVHPALAVGIDLRSLLERGGRWSDLSRIPHHVE